MGELRYEHDLEEHEQWMVAAEILLQNGQQILYKPFVYPNCEWHAHFQFFYTETPYANASTWLTFMTQKYPPAFWHDELPVFNRHNVNRNKKLCLYAT